MLHVIFFVFLLFPITTVFGQNQSSQCPPGTVLSVSKDACFAPVSVDSFYSAELTCLQMGGHLPSVTDALVNEQLAAMGSKYFSCSSVWIGLDVRQKWLDGSLSSYRNWVDGGSPIGSGGPSCASMNVDSDHKWATYDCTDQKGFICSFKPFADMGSTPIPMKSCGLKDQDGNKGTNLTQTITCSIGSNNCAYWNIAVMIGLTKSANIKTKLNQIGLFLDKISDDCNSQSRMFVITPSYAQQECTYQNTTSGGIAVITNNLDATKTTFLTDDPATEIYNMFGALQQCQYFPLLNSYAGAALFFTDIGCDDVCQQIIVNNQREMIDNLTAKMYSIRFVHVGLDVDESQCFKGVFSRCDEYNDKVCTFREYDKEQSASSDPELRVCYVPNNDKPISTVWIIVSVVLGFLIIVGCVAVRCFFRYKSLKKGSRWNWFVFSSNSEDGVPNVGTDPKTVRAAPNEYDEVPREEDPWEIKPENLTYSEQDVLGSGAFATVYLGYLKGEIPLVKVHHGRLKLGLRKEADDSYKVAVKRLPPHATAEGRMDFNHEIEFMKELGYHSHILSLLGIVASVNDALIVIENCEFGDLLTYVRAKKDSFVKEDEEAENGHSSLRTKDLVSIAWQISDGMSYLASKNFIHRDIAARNILLTKSMVAKIGDFGLCRLVDSSLYTAKGGRLPIKWMAPESLKYYEYSLKSDVWSFGVLLFEVFSLGEAPYGTVQPQEMPKYLDAGNRLPQPITCPNEIYEIMEKCWEKVVDQRPDVDQLRDDLTNILNSDSTSYGYLEVQEQKEDNDVCEI